MKPLKRSRKAPDVSHVHADNTADPITNTVETHELAFFEKAVKFLVVRRKGAKRWEVPFEDFALAVFTARQLKAKGHQMLIYAVDQFNGASLLPFDRWPEFEQLWLKKHPIGC